MWRPSVIDWWDNAWYWRDYVRHSSRFILPETIEMYSCKVRQLWSIDVFQPGVNVKLNVIFYLLWTATSCWWWGAPATSSELFSESGLNSTVREQGSTSIFQKHLRRREQMSRETTIYRRPSTVDPERHWDWSTEPARRFVVGSLPDTTTRSCEEVARRFYGRRRYQACLEAFRRLCPSELPPEREKAVFDN